MIPILIYTVGGLLLLALGVRQWRLRKQETVSLIEYGLLKATKSEPVPLSDYDRKSQPVFAVLNIAFGFFFLLLGLLLIAGKAGLL